MPIRHANGTAGTLGFFAQRREEVVLVSSSSVLAPRGSRAGDWIHTVEPDDANELTDVQLSARTGIAKLLEWDVLAGCAALLPHTHHLGNRLVPPPRSLRGSPGVIGTVLSDPSPGLLVGKIGRSSGYTEGALAATNVSGVIVQMTDKRETLENMLEVRSEGDPFCMPGDLGSLVFSLGPLGALGILIAGTTETRPQRALIAPIEPILERFGLEYLGGE